ncbi:MAG: hypothetical protein Q8L09_04735 [Candidatus Moranbacteria bacterium]|nr:hypothetical protein [Candidatus Moranbacteria bacterium]
MSINEYIEKLRAKPARQRERIVVAATAVSFLIILVIWLVSFSEMNKESQVDANPSAVDQLNNLKGDMGDSKKSIEEMWNQLPDQNEIGTQELNDAGADNLNAVQNQTQENNEQNSEIPQLP